MVDYAFAKQTRSGSLVTGAKMVSTLLFAFAGWLVTLLFAFAGRGNPLTLSTARLSQDGGFGLKASSGATQRREDKEKERKTQEALLVQGDATQFGF